MSAWVIFTVHTNMHIFCLVWRHTEDSDKAQDSQGPGVFKYIYWL